jgi:hypothetical protein
MDESLDRNSLAARSQANERELSGVAAMAGLDRELHGAQAERIETGQDDIEWRLGFDSPAHAGSRRWSAWA